jgi:CheY-like chemotaxis protein
MGGEWERQIIVALTANAVSEAKVMFLKNGFNGFLSKPIVLNDLNEVLKEFLPPEIVTFNTESDNEHETTTLEPDTSMGSFMQALSAVKEVDGALGLSHVDGDEDMYKITVEIFAGNILSTCSDMDSLLGDGDIHGFGTSVHAAKSMLSTIGAMGLYEEALALEMAAEKNDSDFCTINYPILLEKLHTLHKKLTEVLNE